MFYAAVAGSLSNITYCATDKIPVYLNVISGPTHILLNFSNFQPGEPDPATWTLPSKFQRSFLFFNFALPYLLSIQRRWQIVM